MEVLTYYNLDKKHKYYLSIPCCLGDEHQQKIKYLVRYEKRIYSESFDIMGIHFKVLKSFIKNLNCDKIYVYVHKDAIYKPIYPLTFITYFNNNLFEEQKNKITNCCNFYKPKYELLFVNSIIRQKIGDPYFNWELIYSK